MRYRTDIRFGAADFIGNLAVFDYLKCHLFNWLYHFSFLFFFNNDDEVNYDLNVYLASIGGLLGLGLGMSFISVIEILYYVFFRRLFLWQRVKLSRLTMRVTRILSRNSRQERKRNPRNLEVTENNNVWPSSATLSSSIATISSSSFDRQIPLTRRHSLNLPPHLQKRLSKY